LFSPPADPGQMRAALESSLRASLLPQLSQQVASDWQARLERLQQESGSALSRAKTEAINAAAADTVQAIQQLLALIHSERAEDQEAVAEWSENLRKQHETDFVSLRKDLETVASTTEDRIRAAQ